MCDISDKQRLKIIQAKIIRIHVLPYTDFNYQSDADEGTEKVSNVGSSIYRDPERYLFHNEFTESDNNLYDAYDVKVYVKALLKMCSNLV